MTDPVARVLEALRVCGHDAKREGSGYIARCPAHDDERPSLSIAEGDDGRALVKCRAGCDTTAVVSACGLEMRDLFASNGAARLNGKHGPAIVKRTSWKLEDATGAVVAEHHRLDFADGSKKVYWTSNGKNGLQGRKSRHLPLYGLRKLFAATRPATVVVAEGEKAADAIRSHGILAVGTVTGASGTPSDATLAVLAGCHVVLWPDHDEVGRAHMRRIAARLEGRAANVRFLTWSDGEKEGDDAADFFDRGGTSEQAAELIAAAACATIEEPAARRNTAPAADDTRPTIEIKGGELPAIVQAAEDALLGDTAGEPIYQRNGALVRVVRDGERKEAGGVRRATGAPIIVPLTAAYLVLRLTRAAQWRKYDARADGLVPKDCPEPVAKALLANRGNWRFPELLAVVETPTIRADGSILTVAGYDPATRLIFDPGSVVFPLIPERPTQADARAAREFLEDIVCDFPYEAASDRSAFVATILTVLARHLFDLAPLFVFGAPTARSGKSLQVKAVGIIATGREPAFMAQADDEEDRKRLLMLALEGDLIAVFDNINRPFGSAALDMAITSATVKDRAMREHSSAHAKLVATLCATGNNITYRGDTAARVIPCDLLPEQERPEERTTFRYPNLLEHVRALRPELVAAGLTILSAYVMARRPPQAVAPFGGFEQWRALVPSAIVFAGGADPIAGRTRVLNESDPSADLARSVVAAIHRVLGSQEFTVAVLIRRSDDDAELATLLRAAAPSQEGGKVDPKRIGDCLTRWKKANRGGLRLVRVMDGGKAKLVNKAAAWRVDVAGSGDSGGSGDSSLRRMETVEREARDIHRGSTGTDPDNPEVPVRE